MQEMTEQYRAACLDLCDRLLLELKRNREDTDLFFAGEVNKAYVKATDKAIEKARSLRNKIRHL